MSRAFFEHVAEALIGFLPPGCTAVSSRVSGRNLKVCVGPEAREHYEVQAVRRDGAPVLEIGFHSEHPDAARNDEVLARLLRGEPAWRQALGEEAEAGRFLGRSSPWRRISETWDDFDLDEPGAAVEAADRLATYIAALEPLRHVEPVG
jgi:hypothetical protein